MSNEHGYCPSCKVDLDGGSIWETGLELHGSEERADSYAAAYGATRTKGKWGREIGLYDLFKDRTVRYQCPDCGHEWSL
jgi:hypothetical protein